jgi:hypothetical protein
MKMKFAEAQKNLIDRLYEAKNNGITVLIDSKNDPDYEAYKGLPYNVQRFMDTLFSVKVV